MNIAPSLSRIGCAVLLGAAGAAGATTVGVSEASTAAVVTPTPTLTASPIARPPATLKPGTAVRSSSLGQRVFVDAKHGFALASLPGAQYPAATSDGGQTWKTDGPALHLNAAQAPLAVVDIGAATRTTVFAFGGAQAVDTTSDGGRKWYRVLFNGLVMAVVTNTQRHLVAFVDSFPSTTGAGSVTWQYVSKNGGRTWNYDSTVGGS